MPLSKRKRQNDDSEAAVHHETTRRVTRLSSEVKTRRASKLHEDVSVEDDEENEDSEEEEEEEERVVEEVRTTRSRAKAHGQSVNNKIETKQPGQKRRLRGGRTAPERGHVAAPRRRTRQAAARETEIADSDAAEDDEDDDEEADENADTSEDDRSIPDSETLEDGAEEEEEEEEEEDRGKNSPPHTRRLKPIVSPPTPPSQPRRETTIKPPCVPSMPAVAPAAAAQPPAARPKKVTEIKPPAPRLPAKTTPIQPPAPGTSAAAPPAQQQRQQQQQAKPTTTQPAPPPRPRSPSQPDRNIDKVVLGTICFKAWYPSYYGKEVLGDTAGNSHHHGRGGHASSKGQSGKENHASAHGGPSGKNNHHGGSGGAGHKESTPILDRLYVCPFCFKYSREIVPWHGHVQVCESRFQIPGEKVYVHPKGVRTIRVPIASTTAVGGRGGSSKRRKSGSGGGGGSSNSNNTANAVAGSPSSGGSATATAPPLAPPADQDYIEQTVTDEGEWSVWEVDGERDVLFCQNISLFAKLFLDTKSVFFDVTGFKYFLLVYTPPPSLPSSLRAAATATMSGSGAVAAGQPPASILGGAAPRPRVVGFFSKEKLSWDNNNLACILVFPPWQRKGLGALLMGVSYEIARREGVLGGPEKPISDLGKKGYRRFWAGEIARWLLSIDIGATLAASSSEDAPSTEGHQHQQELVIDIDDCSAATWIVRDDCLYVLREMGIVEEAGMGPPKRFCENVLPRQAVVASAAVESAGAGAGADVPVDASAAAAAALHGLTLASTTTAAAPEPPATRAASAEVEPAPQVKRVRISKAAVWQWVQDNHISLERACDPAGFLKDYSPKEAMAED